ncbi:MAG: hypothetical protein KF685_12365 [Acidobacteria bacterium]|nr:hypothetical protein [Acidobacteriota bacterium]
MKNRPVPAGKVSAKPIIVIAAAARNSDGSIKISLLTDAHETLSDLLVQPLILLNGMEGRQPGDKAGEVTSISLEGPKADEALANPVVIIAADAGANAIEVRFVIGAAENEQRLLIPLKDEPEIAAVRFIE